MTTIEFSKKIASTALKMVYDAKASHIGGALSMTDILAVLYNDILNIYPDDPKNELRDRFLLSKGHCCSAYYSTLAIKGFFPMSELSTYGKDNSRLLSHTTHKVEGIEISAGSLGHGLPIACGIAYAAKIKNQNFKTFCLVGDGEMDEGSNWEALLFAAQHKLSNLCLIIDYNKIQSFGTIEEVLSLEPLRSKLEAFNWYVEEVNGHDHDSLREAFTKVGQVNSPIVVIAHTIKGAGVSFMENRLEWHYKSPNEDQYIQAIQEINSK